MYDKETQEMIDNANAAIDIVAEVEKNKIPIIGTSQEIAREAIDRVATALKKACDRNEGSMSSPGYLADHPAAAVVPISETYEPRVTHPEGCMCHACQARRIAFSNSNDHGDEEDPCD